MAQNASLHFAQLALQYFVAGRSAAIDQMIPVLGNLLHHAVEMALKATLAPSLGMPALKTLGHNLPRMWARFKEIFPAVDVSRFDLVIAELHKFEELRYPDSIIQHGAMMGFALFREQVVSASSSVASTPHYAIVLEDIDELQELLFAVGNINPRALTGSMSESAKQHLFLHNRHASKW